MTRKDRGCERVIILKLKNNKYSITWHSIIINKVVSNRNLVFKISNFSVLTTDVKFWASLLSILALWMLTKCTLWPLRSNSFTKLINQTWWLVDARGSTTKIDSEFNVVASPIKMQQRNKHLNIVEDEVTRDISSLRLPRLLETEWSLYTGDLTDVLSIFQLDYSNIIIFDDVAQNIITLTSNKFATIRLSEMVV